MRPVVKVENGVGRALAVEGLQPEADAGRPWLRRRLSEAGAAVSDEALSRRAFLEADALAVEGMERTRVLGEELLQAKAQIAKLEAEARIQDVIIQSKDEQLQQAKFTQLAAASAAADYVFQEGQRLYGEQRYSDAAQRWGQAALLQHAPSHAFLSNMLNDGKPGVGKDGKRAFELAAAGVALGCAHSKGALGRCYVFALGVAEDAAKGLALGRESAATGSCFGQFVVGSCYYSGAGVARDKAEAVRLWRLAAAPGHADAQFNLGVMFSKGEGAAQDQAEAVRSWRLAAAQGHADAQNNLGYMFEKGQGAAQDKAEAVRLYRLAAAQGHAGAQNNLGRMFDNVEGVATRACSLRRMRTKQVR
jgi:TPR repeat protein